MHEDAVAIVGMACRLPGAGDVRAFWDNLVAGRDTVSRFTPDQLAAAGTDRRLAERPDFVAARGVVAGADRFDWSFFGYSLGEARGIDPQQRVFLECASTALDDAAIDPHRFPGPIGVFAGCDAVPLGASQEELVSQTLGRDKDFLATRAAYKLRLTGPALTVQTACSTSLVAVHQAVQSLLGYECDAALAGGVGLFFPQVTGYVYEEGGILSPDGHCRPFDADAAGTVSSSGAGVVVLRRLEDALRDGDRVVAVIRGTAVNNDGGDKAGFTAPSPGGQRDVILAALGRADVDPADVGYVEAHGTATRLGDPVEVAALTAAFRTTTDAVGSCVLGAVKGNIGHTGSASGVSGLIKTALLLWHRELVPTMHFRRPNPLMKLETTPFTVADRHGPWPEGRPALAGVSSFGVGGTNAHAVLEAAPTPRATGAGARGPRLLALSASSPEALRAARSDLAQRLRDDRPPRLDEVARTLADGRRRYAHRATVVARDVARAAEALSDLGEPLPDGPATAEPTGVAFLYPGQGTLCPGGAAAGAYAVLPAFAEAFDEVRAWARQEADTDLSPLLSPRTPPEWYHDPVHQQLGLFALGHALTRTLDGWDIRPSAVMGNSIGEYAAALAAGVWELPDALRLVHTRALATRDTAPGRMLAVELVRDGDREAVTRALEQLPGPRPAVAVDGHDRLVLSGPPEAVQRLAERLEGRPARLLETSRAFHSRQMAPAAAALRARVARLTANAPRTPLVSNVTGGWATPGEVASADYWAAQLTDTVRLRQGLDTLLSGGAEVFVELGPGASMSRAVRDHPRHTARHLTVPLLDGATDDAEARVLEAVGRLWEAGLSVEVGQFAGGSRQRCSLPPHPLDSRPCGTGTDQPAAPAVPATAAPGPAPATAVPAPHLPRAAPAATAHAATARRIAEDLQAPPAADRPTLSERPGLVRRLDEYTAALATRLGLRIGRLAPGDAVSARELTDRLAGHGELAGPARLMVRAMTEHGFLTEEATGATDAEDAAPGGQRLLVPDDIEERLRSALDPARLDEARGLRRMLDHCAGAYPEVLAGEREPVSVLYPDGSDTFLRACLTDNTVDVADAGPCLDQLAAAVAASRGPREAGRPLRVLEVGGGSGELTGRVLESWPAHPQDLYTFTDVSALALSRARERAAERGRGQVRCARLDLSKDLGTQGFPARGFDIVLAYNALHVVPDLPATLRRLRGLLAAGGWLGAVEVTRVALWTHFMWGLAPGWWDFADDLRTDSVHLPADEWRRALDDAGFSDVAVVQRPSADHAVLLASVDEAVAPSVPSGAPGPRPSAVQDSPEGAAAQAPAAAAGLAGIWNQLLGTSSARDEDDFFALGGDSLMAVRLRGRIHEDLGIAVPLADFLEQPTFGRLAALAQETRDAGGAGDTGAAGGERSERAPAAPRELVRFHEGDRGTPLFLAAPAAGSSLCYREFARAIGGDRPVYGIDAPGLLSGAPTPDRVEDLAAHHIRVLRAVRPHGPYAVGGWSVGGLVAHEMAAQLERAGERVELLLFLDGFAPDSGGRPLGSAPQHLAAGLWHQALVALQIGPAGRAVRSVPGVNRVFRAYLRAMLRYRPRPVSCRTVLFKAGLTHRTEARLRTWLSGLHPGGLTVLPCSGRHWTMLTEPHASALAHQARRALDGPDR
ncbi:polyketide synthase [Streptomyces sp. ME19-01-6]|uniref:polyketide synthase n=1 Tax=Streptomyces sp. ME19-01-6 TaxID=3028686 RepID=UPI0029BA76CD|nr:polyketide synthase [Streptomyces sp. ME19-01-6]MDX3229010.1 beta-ketoacyl synthase N-terminal-like domain-containing protein [Streptomyces sp. ME19-01-6]